MKIVLIVLSGLFLMTISSCTKAIDSNSKHKNESAITNAELNGGGTSTNHGNGNAGKF